MAQRTLKRAILATLGGFDEGASANTLANAIDHRRQDVLKAIRELIASHHIVPTERGLRRRNEGGSPVPYP